MVKYLVSMSDIKIPKVSDQTLTRSLTLGILFSTALIAVVLANSVILVVLSSILVILAFESVF